MKKLSVLFVALAVALSAAAAGPMKANVRKVHKNKIMTEQVMDKQAIAQAKKAPAREPITEDPEGEAFDFQRAGGAVYASSGYLYLGDQTGSKARFVFDADGTTVYIRDLLYYANNNFGHAWVKGTVEGNTLTIPMGQSIYWSDEYNADVVLCWGSTEVVGETSIGFTRDESVTAVTYTIDPENQTYTLEGTVAPTSTDSQDANAYCGTGLSAYWTDDDSWSGYVEWNTVFSDPAEPMASPTVITEIPEGCQTYTYYRKSSCIYNSFFGIGESETDGKFTVAFDMTNGDVYIQNPSWWNDYYGAWVKGTYDWMTGIIAVPTGQFLYWSEEGEYGIQLGWGSTYVYEDVDEEGETGYYLGTKLDEEATEIEFMIDDDYIYLLNSKGDINAEFPDNYNATGLYTYYSDDLSMTDLEFANLGEDGYALPFGEIVNLVPAVPADPTADDWYDCGDESGFSKFYFTLPTTDVDGNTIDPEYLSFSIFIDDEEEPFVFDAATYSYDIDEDMTEIPYYLYSSGYDFYTDHVYFYRTNEGDNPLFTKRIGIQVYYTVDSPEEKVAVRNASNIIYYEDPTTAIESVKAELDLNAPIYNIMGQKMNSTNLPAGVYIQNGKKFIVK